MWHIRFIYKIPMAQVTYIWNQIPFVFCTFCTLYIKPTVDMVFINHAAFWDAVEYNVVIMKLLFQNRLPGAIGIYKRD